MPEPLFCVPVIQYWKMTGDYNIRPNTLFNLEVIQYRKMAGDYNTTYSHNNYSSGPLCDLRVFPMLFEPGFL
jgi:hypothetical protein